MARIGGIIAFGLMCQFQYLPRFNTQHVGLLQMSIRNRNMSCWCHGSPILVHASLCVIHILRGIVQGRFSRQQRTCEDLHLHLIIYIQWKVNIGRVWHLHDMFKQNGNISLDIWNLDVQSWWKRDCNLLLARPSWRFHPPTFWALETVLNLRKLWRAMWGPPIIWLVGF